MDEFGYWDARLAVARGRERRPHDYRDAFKGCPCSTCARIRRDAERYGFDARGQIDYAKREVRQPWQVAA